MNNPFQFRIPEDLKLRIKENKCNITVHYEYSSLIMNITKTITIKDLVDNRTLVYKEIEQHNPFHPISFEDWYKQIKW